jgi:zinc protease
MTSTRHVPVSVENLDPTLDLFADVIRNPTFPQTEVDKYKTRTLAQLQFQRSIPQFSGGGAVSARDSTAPSIRLRWLPRRRVDQETDEQDLAGFHSTYYRPNNAILAIVGDVTMKDVMPKIQKAFGDWQKADVPGDDSAGAGAISVAHFADRSSGLSADRLATRHPRNRAHQP